MIDIQSFELSNFFLIQFEFPKLQALSIIFSYTKVAIDFNDDLFWQSIGKFADLEYLEIQWGVAITPDQFSALCCSLTKLRYFVYFKNSVKPFGMQMFHTLFQRCPSLRLIVQGDPQSYSVKYFKDIGTNTVEHVLWPTQKNYFKAFIYEEIPRKYFPYKDYHRYSPDSRYRSASSANAP